MAINPNSSFPTKTAVPSAEYPYGSARNITTPGDGTGTPWRAEIVNDIFGFQQSLLDAAGIVPSGQPDEVGASQYLESARMALGAVVQSISSLQALEPVAAGQKAFLSSGDRSGDFIWTLGDFASEVALDNLQGVYIASNTVASSSGCWIRKLFGFVTPEMFGGGDLGILAADTAARNLDLPLAMSGSYSTSSTITITAQTLITDNVVITKDLDDTPVLVFQGQLSGLDGRFREHRGKLTCLQSAQPTSLQTNAHGIVFDNVVESTLGDIEGSQCYYGFVNDTANGIGLSWGNDISKMRSRGVTGGFKRWNFSGTGGHTENNVGAAYFNGKEYSSPALIQIQDTPVYLNNCEGFVYGTFNYEWVSVAAGVTKHFNLVNASTLIIGAFHPEGLEMDSASDVSIIGFTNVGTVNASCNIANIHINNFNQTGAGTLSLVGGDSAAAANCSVGTISGSPSSNTITDFRLLDTDSSKIKLSVASPEGYSSYFTSVAKGVIPSDLSASVVLGGQPYYWRNFKQNPGATIDVGRSKYMRLSGTSTADITTVSTTADNGDSVRSVTILNNTSAPINIVGTGNISSPLTLPVSLPVNGVATFTCNIVNNKAVLLGVG